VRSTPDQPLAPREAEAHTVLISGLEPPHVCQVGSPFVGSDGSDRVAPRSPFFRGGVIGFPLCRPVLAERPDRLGVRLVPNMVRCFRNCEFVQAVSIVGPRRFSILSGGVPPAFVSSDVPASSSGGWIQPKSASAASASSALTSSMSKRPFVAIIRDPPIVETELSRASSAPRLQQFASPPDDRRRCAE